MLSPVQSQLLLAWILSGGLVMARAERNGAGSFLSMLIGLFWPVLLPVAVIWLGVTGHKVRLVLPYGDNERKSPSTARSYPRVTGRK